jgi:hypothetical protein
MYPSGKIALFQSVRWATCAKHKPRKRGCPVRDETAEEGPRKALPRVDPQDSSGSITVMTGSPSSPGPMTERRATCVGRTLVGDVQRAALMLADVALVPSSQSGAEVWGNTDTIALISQAQTINTGLKATLVFVRKLPKTALGKGARAILENGELPVFASETTFRIAWQEAITAGMGVAQYAPRDKGAKELRALVEELLAFGAVEIAEVVNG